MDTHYSFQDSQLLLKIPENSYFYFQIKIHLQNESKKETNSKHDEKNSS